MGIRLTVKNVRLAFGALWEPEPFPNDPDNLSCGGKFVIPKDHPQIAEIEAAMLAAAEERWPGKAKAIYDNFTKTGRKPEVPFVKAPYTNKNGEVYGGFEDAFTLHTRNGAKSADKVVRPTVFDQFNQPVTKDSGVVYNGCYVDAAVEFYAPKEDFGRRISCTLRGVRKAGDGEAFGGATRASADEFGAPAEVEEDFV